MLRSTIMWKIFISKDININNSAKLPSFFVLSETLKNHVSYLRNAGTVAVNKKPQNKLLLLIKLLIITNKSLVLNYSDSLS